MAEHYAVWNRKPLLKSRSVEANGGWQHEPPLLSSGLAPKGSTDGARGHVKVRVCGQRKSAPSSV